MRHVLIGYRSHPHPNPPRKGEGTRARPVSLQQPCSHFVLDSSFKLSYILAQSCSTRGALARRRKKREQNTVSGRGSHPLPREAQAACRACPQPQARLTKVGPA